MINSRLRTKKRIVFIGIPSKDNGLWIHQDAWFPLEFEEQTSSVLYFEREWCLFFVIEELS